MSFDPMFITMVDTLTRSRVKLSYVSLRGGDKDKTAKDLDGRIIKYGMVKILIRNLVFKVFRCQSIYKEGGMRKGLSPKDFV